jgi:type IV secretion system protein VirB9
MKTFPLFILAFIAASASGQTPPASPSSASAFDSGLLGGNHPVLNDQERVGVTVTQAWRDESTVEGQPGVANSVKFRFDESLPSVVCAILQVTDIELQTGEKVTHINLGDSMRWSVESAISGTEPDEVEHLIVKPRDIGLSTSLVVTPDRRTYHLLLVSDAADFMHAVSFVYGDEPKPAQPVVAATAATPPPVQAPSSPRRHRSTSGGKQVVAVDHGPVDDADES